jgi:uncharacterized protein (TIGR00251 family)
MAIAKKRMIIKVQVKPSAKQSEILEESEGFLKVAISAPAYEGKANSELIKFLKKAKGWKATILKGKTSKTKLVQVLDE